VKFLYLPLIFNFCEIDSLEGEVVGGGITAEGILMDLNVEEVNTC
jgi:hypothetical protein